MSQDTQNKPSDRSNIKVSLETRQGTFTVPANEIVELTMIEDIFSGAIVGKLSFFDREGGVELLPIIGHEPLSIMYGEDSDTEKLFFIFSVNGIKQVGQYESYAMNLIELYFAEPMFFTTTQRRFSVSWTNTKISDIIKDIFKYMALTNQGWALFEESIETLDNFYMPYWTPFEAVKWLLPRARGSESLQSGYLAYSNTKGLNLVTLEKLLKQTQLEKDFLGNPLQYVFESAAPNYPNKILGFEILGVDSMGMNDLKGGTKLGYDFLTKSFISSEYDYSDVVSKYTMLGKKTLFPDISDTRTRYDLVGESDEQTLKNIAYCELIKRYVKQHQIIITVKGHERRYAGMLVDIIWPSANKENIMNQSFEGKYLVKSVTNRFSGKSQPYWKQVMVLMKTAYTDSSVETLVKSTKYNLETNAVRLGKKR